jgi:hypothetical protein
MLPLIVFIPSSSSIPTPRTEFASPCNAVHPPSQIPPNPTGLVGLWPALSFASNPLTGFTLFPALIVLRDGCFEGIGLTALLPLGVLVPLVLTSSCSVLINRRFLGLIDEDVVPASLSGKARGEAVLIIADGFMIRLLRGPPALEACDHESLEAIGLSLVHFKGS